MNYLDIFLAIIGLLGLNTAFLIMLVLYLRDRRQTFTRIDSSYAIEKDANRL